MTKDVIVKTETAMSTQDTQAVLADLGFSATDLMIPKLLLMQNTSERVGDGVAVLGEIINSVTLEKVGDFKGAVEIIPLKANKTWVVYDITGKQPEFMRQEPLTAANENLPWEDKEDDKLIRRDQSLNFYCLLVSEVAGGEAFPVVVSFRRTGYQAGKVLATHLLKMRMFAKPSYAKTVMLKSVKEKKDTNTYAKFEITLGRVSSPEEVKAAQTWLDMLSTKEFKVDESDLKQDGDKAAEAPASTRSARPAIVVGKEEEKIY